MHGPQLSARPIVIQTEELDPVAAAWLRERAELIECPYTDATRLGSALARAQGLIVRTYTTVDDALLAKASLLKVVGRAGVALNNIDVPACRRRGVEVVHTPGANTRAVVELVAAFMLDALRPRAYLTGPLEGKPWHDARARNTAVVQLSDLTLGIWGLGRVGQGVARLGAALDMRVLYNDLLDIPPTARSGTTPVDVSTLLAQSDVLSVHVDARASNHNLVNADAFSRMRPSVLFINTSRGLVVDPRALAAHFRAHPRAQAYLDVHDPHEPIPPDYPPLGIPNIRLTPHIASGTTTAKTNMSWVVRDVWRVLSGEPPLHPAPAV